MDDFHSSPQIGTESDSRVINLVVNIIEFAMPWMILLIPTISHRILIHPSIALIAGKQGRIHPGFIENLPHLYICILFLGGNFMFYPLLIPQIGMWNLIHSSIAQRKEGFSSKARNDFHPESST
jgi:hypothetical protein